MSPFPLQSKSEYSIVEALALVNLLVGITRLAILMDNWKRTLNEVAPKFKDTFPFFMNNYKVPSIRLLLWLSISLLVSM